MRWFDPTLAQESWVWSFLDRPLKTRVDFIQLFEKKTERELTLNGFFFDRAGSSLIEVRSRSVDRGSDIWVSGYDPSLGFDVYYTQLTNVSAQDTLCTSALCYLKNKNILNF